MTREEAKEIALKMCKDSIEKYGEDAIYFSSPCIGKCSWTYKETLDSIVNDTVLENTNLNIIDSVLNAYKYFDYVKSMLKT